MVVTNEEIASKIIYLKENNYIPNLDSETKDVQRIIRSFYISDKIYKRDTNNLKDNYFWFRLTFCNYMVTDKFVHEINREFKRFQIKNIAVKEFDN